MSRADPAELLGGPGALGPGGCWELEALAQRIEDIFFGGGGGGPGGGGPGGGGEVGGAAGVAAVGLEPAARGTQHEWVRAACERLLPLARPSLIGQLVEVWRASRVHVLELYRCAAEGYFEYLRLSQVGRRAWKSGDGSGGVNMQGRERKSEREGVRCRAREGVCA